MYIIIAILSLVILYQQSRIRHWRKWWLIAMTEYDHVLEDFDIAAASLYDITGIDIRS